MLFLYSFPFNVQLILIDCVDVEQMGSNYFSMKNMQELFAHARGSVTLEEIFDFFKGIHIFDKILTSFMNF